MKSSLFLLVSICLVLIMGCDSEPMNSQLTTLVSPGIIPQPAQFFSKNQYTDLPQKVSIHAPEHVLREAHFLQAFLNEKGVEAQFNSNAQIYFMLVEGMGAEAYRINCDDESITINYSTPAGAFYAVQSLIQLFEDAQFNEDGMRMVSVQIEDSPRFQHRGMLFDCCRHFMSVDFVKRYIDLLASYKMNVLHWHLTEDQGWRIASDAYPKLTEIGAYRTELDGSQHGGYYTKEEMKEVVAYAAERHITVIPEVEMPGHSSAAIAAYPWLSCTQEQIDVENEWGVFKEIYCAGNDQTIQFLETILDEVCEIFPSTYIHIGGDEAPKTRWEQCAKCQQRIESEGLTDENELQSWFIQHFVNYLSSKGRKAIGWDEILEGGLPKGAVVQSWRGFEGGEQAAKLGHEVIMSPTSHAYFDYPIKSIDVAKVYAFNPIPTGLSPEEQRLILGGECNMWTEHAPLEKVDAKMFPRMLAMAEALWSSEEAKSETDFFNRLRYEYPVLKRKGVDFGIEAVPVVVRPMRTEHIGRVAVELLQQIPDAQVLWRESGTTPWNALDSVPAIEGSTTLEVTTTRWGEAYGDTLKVPLAAHEALWQQIELPYGYSDAYSGGGDAALVDGLCGTEDFRDGRWQALQLNNMEALITFDTLQTLSSIQTQFYTYSNAWIFMPESLVVSVELPNGGWQQVVSISNPLDLGDERQAVVPMGSSFEPIQTQRVKVVAVNRKFCPEWHDAPGEPAWLFCDELVLR